MKSYSLLFENLESFKIKGLTKNIIEKLKKLEIFCLYDLFYFFPRDYVDKAKRTTISKISDLDRVQIQGKVTKTINRYFGKRNMYSLVLDDGTGYIDVVWFNNKFISRSIKENDMIELIGKVNRKGKLQIVNPNYRKISSIDYEVENSDEEFVGKESIYPLVSGLKQEKLRSIIKEAITSYSFLLHENLPKEFLEKTKIISREEAIKNIHFPENEKLKNASKKRLIFEEIAILEMAILKNRYVIDRNNNEIYKLNGKKDLVKKFVSSLEYELTNAQKKVITEIYKELNKGKILNRLIQGDVGSGKTIVSLILLLYMVENDYQAVIMAPTEILANQHYIETKNKFKDLNVNVELLTGSIKGAKKEKILEDIKQNKINIIIGTHALIEDNVEFKKLGLIVIDEQHRFGVEQRNKLREKGVLSNLIVMSATPIPRSLALTIYGDLDISIIDELPKGRIEIKTKWIKTEKEKIKMYHFINKKILEGRQIYVVSPLIEESEKLMVDSALKTFEEYQKIFEGKKIGLLHGKQKAKEKKEIMEKFKNKDIDILISTTVIEVGIDVHNASIIVIRSAERFGLSSLHQLRGRVGRGKYSSYCFLESDSINEITEKRLRIMEETLNGFEIAEQDLKLRNTGEIFGTKQSGLSELVMVDIVKNIKEISLVRDFVLDYLKNTKGKVENKYLDADIKHKMKIVE